jgi:uncharacterized membrane protein
MADQTPASAGNPLSVKKDVLNDAEDFIPLSKEKSLTLRGVYTEFRGPLPPPDLLRQYNEVIPNGAERIIALAEKQSAHRIEMEKIVISSQQGRSRLGQWFGFILGLTGMSVGGWVAVNGQPLAGASIAGATLVGLVAVFVTGTYQIATSLQKRKPQIDSEEKD